MDEKIDLYFVLVENFEKGYYISSVETDEENAALRIAEFNGPAKVVKITGDQIAEFTDPNPEEEPEKKDDQEKMLKEAKEIASKSV